MVLPDKKDNLEVKHQVVELFKLERQFNEMKKSYQDKKEKLTVAIKNYMYCNKGMTNDFQFRVKSKQSGDQMVTVKKIEPTSIVWNAEKLEQVLDKEDCKLVIEKTYTISDMEGLVTYLKFCGVSPKRFKSFIEVTRKVDESALEQLDAVGKINREELEDCFTVDKKSSYLRISMMEDNE